MRSKAILSVLIGLALLLSFSIAVKDAKADTIIFPYINENTANVSTVISVINGTSSIGGVGVVALHYRYITKLHSAGLLDACSEWDFYRPTSENDLVTFDATGTLASGIAMFGDPGAGYTAGMTQITYNAGANAPYFHDISTDPRRGYLLVSHAQTITGPDVAAEGPLDGEAVLFDIVNAAAWGYRAGVNTTANYAFATSDEILVEALYSFYENTVIFPPNQFTTRYFVTPLAINTNLATSYAMTATTTATQKRTRIGLYGWGATVSLFGVFDRNEQFGSGGGLVHLRCVAGIDLATLIGAANNTWITSTGGWATVDLADPVFIVAEGETVVNADSYDAFVYDLKYGNFTGYTGMINDGKVIRTRAGQPRP